MALSVIRLVVYDAGGEVETFDTFITYRAAGTTDINTSDVEPDDGDGAQTRKCFYKGVELWQKYRRLKEHNANVSDVRCFTAISREVIDSLAEFFLNRIPETEFKELEPLRHILPSVTDDQLRNCHQMIVRDTKLSDFVSSYREVCDELTPDVSRSMSPREVFKFVCKTDAWKTLRLAIARMLAAKPHSADVERLISSYNQLKTAERSSLSESTLSEMLSIRHNMPPIALWDPRPATYNWMTSKERRPEQNPSKAKEQKYFKGVFF